MTSEIKFGTDGWRALIARDFTFENVTRVAHAVVRTMKETSPSLRTMIVGYDRRFLSRAFAETAAAVYGESGYRVLLSQSFVPTPALSWWAKNDQQAAGATVITASHNPPEWNGFKFKEPFGGSARPITTVRFEEWVKQMKSETIEAPTPELVRERIASGAIERFDPMPHYIDAMLKQVDTDAIRKLAPKIGLDVMYGAASTHYKALLEKLGVHPECLHDEENPSFGGTPPEPIGKNLKELCQRVSEQRLACGLATDGDADRLGAVDETGTYFTTQEILSTVYWHMLKNRKKKWSISRSVSTTRMVDLIAERAGMECHETPVGFKFIAEKMVEGEAQIGGEESGGIGVMDHIPERDGLLTGLLLLEVMAVTGKGLRAVYQNICKEYRPYAFTRLDIHLTTAQAEAAMARLKKSPPSKWEGRKVERLLTIDGSKFYCEDGSWILIRASGTEPIFRLYAEAESEAASQSLVAAAKRFVERA